MASCLWLIDVRLALTGLADASLPVLPCSPVHASDGRTNAHQLNCHVSDGLVVEGGVQSSLLLTLYCLLLFKFYNFIFPFPLLG